MRNYFNYFTEIEEYFVRKRGKNLLVSPLDWCLIELWKDNGIPLNVALRGIDRSFESAQQAARKPPRTLFYCHPAVMDAFEEHRHAMLGRSESEASPPGGLSREEVLGRLTRLQEALADSDEAVAKARRRITALKKEIERAQTLDYQAVDRDLGAIGEALAQEISAQIDRAALKELRIQIREETRIYRRRLDKESFKRLESNYLNRTLLKRKGYPAFSLFPFDE